MMTPKGSGYANFLIERGMEFDLEWVVFLDNKEVWSFQNRDVRLDSNITFGRVDGKRKRTDEYAEAAARAEQYLQSEIPSTTRSLGRGATQFVYRPPATAHFYNDDWVVNLVPTKSPSSGETATRVLGKVAGSDTGKSSIRKPKRAAKHIASKCKIRD